MKAQLTILTASILVISSTLAQQTNTVTNSPPDLSPNVQELKTDPEAAFDFIDAARTIQELVSDATKGFNRTNYLDSIERRASQAEAEVRAAIRSLDNTPKPTNAPPKLQAIPSQPKATVGKLVSENQTASPSGIRKEAAPRDFGLELDAIIERIRLIERRLGEAK